MRRRARKPLPSVAGRLLLLAVVFAVAPTGFGSSGSPVPPASQATGTISGRVIDENGQPFANVIVSIQSVREVEKDQRDVVTDEDGSFQANDLSPTAYRVTCEAAGYLEEDEGLKRYHFIGAFVTLRLRKGGAITGSITNALGEPIVKATVRLSYVRDEKGRPRPAHHLLPWTHTDDRGIYRCYGLPAGAYLVFVNRTGEFNDTEFRNEAAIYFPSATRDNAREVMVNLGQEVSGIDIRFRGERGHLVSGRVTGGRGSEEESIHLKLFNASHKSVEAEEAQFTHENSSFTFYGVPDGDYYVIAETRGEEAYRASLPRRLTVKGRDVTGLELNLVLFSSITGRAVFDKSAKTKCQERRQSAVQEIQVSAFDSRRSKADSDWIFEPVADSLLDEKGRFAIGRFLPGQYVLTAKPLDEDLYIRSLIFPARRTAEGKGNEVTLKAAEQWKDVTVHVAGGAAGISGQLSARDEKTKLPEGLQLCLIPAEAENANNSLRFAEARVDKTGGFALTSIAPGRYLIFIRALGESSDEPTDSLAALSGEQRAQLRRDAEALHLAVELQPCQRLSGYKLPYPLLKSTAEAGPSKDSPAAEPRKPQAPLPGLQPAAKQNTRKRKSINQ